ncbi:MAG TPA: alpha-2-macroglobulin family protein, partial [Chroococcales cyanobacterium]
METEVTDLTRMTVDGSGSILATPADFELFVDPTSYVTKVGDDFSVDTSAINYEGKPVANQNLTVRLIRYIWDRAKGEYRGVEVKSTAEVRTDANGKAHVVFHTSDQWPCDTFWVIAESKDKLGNLAHGSSSIWVASEKERYVAWNDEEASKQPLELKLDKKVYQPGETAKIMVSAPLRGTEGVDAIVSVEGTRIYDYKLKPLNATAQLIEIPIKREYIPNAFINVCFVGKKHQFYNTTKMIRVAPQMNFLNIAVSTDKQKYKPAETIKYTIKATHLDGSPAPNTELSLGVVDESIYAIMPDSTENIQKFFYSQRSNWVLTSSSFPEEYSGGPDKTEPRVRKDFKDTAQWLPNLITNKDGVATAAFKLPDNLTTWRATVRGVDTQTDVGSAIQKVIVSQDLIVRLGMPRFFTEDDQSTVTAVVHNYTDKAQSVKLTFAPSLQLQTKESLEQTLNVAADKSARFDWPITAVRSGVAKVRIKAVGQTAGDALEKEVPIRPLGIPAFSVKTGLVTDDNARIEIPIGESADTEPGTAKIDVSLASSSIGPVLGNFNALIDYPYGCTEQTLSRMVPSIVAYKLHKQLGLPLSANDRSEFDTVYG